MNKAMELLRGLVSEIERQTCEHEETHRGGAIWEICDSCGAKWADDEGGKPEFEWPESVEKAREFLAAHPAVEKSGGDERAAFELFVRKHCGMPEHIAVNWDAKFTNDAWEGWKARAALAKPSPAQAEQPTDDDYEEVLADHRRLVREMDVLLNGEACAAKQAMLCDLVSQVEAEVRKSGQPLLVSAERYRWLRNDDNWGADDSEGQGTSKWANLGELSGTDFDAYLDQLRGSNPVMDIDPEHSKAIAKRGRDAIVAQAEGAPVVGCLCGTPMTEGHHSPDGCCNLEEFAPNPAQSQAEGFTHFPELMESVQQMDAMLKANSAQAERPEVVGSAWRNIYNNGFDHVAPFPPAPGGPVVDEPLMTVAQHAASVARWAEMFNRVEQERDAALARVAELDKQCRDDVARALGLRPSQERGFAWSYLLASIKSCVKASEDAAQAQHSVPAYVSYTTRPAESLAGIALRQLKEESRWVEIRDINAPAFPDMQSHSYYPAGTVIKLPAAAPGKEVGHE
ncbi:hypothetical protein HT124_25155 [Pseudomonas aeruginosa]|nr:hypothetical protein [Pseudomonas aeruginosa]